MTAIGWDQLPVSGGQAQYWQDRALAAEARLFEVDRPQPTPDLLDRMAEALRQIEVEANRTEGNWRHLKRVIGVHARAALAEYAKEKG